MTQLAAYPRRATAADAEGIKALVSQNPDQLLPRTVSEILDLVSAFWVLEHNGKIVGCCCLEVYSSKIAEIRSVAVAPRFRRKGYGRALVETAVKEALSKNIHEVLVITSNPQFFERIGFGACLNEKYALFWTGESK